MVCTIATFVENSRHLLDKIFYVRRAGPDIEDCPDPFAGAQIVVDGAEKTIFAAAIDPRGANDITSTTSVAYGFLARNLGSAICIYRSRFVLDRVRWPADRLAVK